MKSRFDLLSKPSESKTEEIIAALWFNAALLAWLAHIHWLAWILFIKAISDLIFSHLIAIKEIRKELRRQKEQ